MWSLAAYPDFVGDIMLEKGFLTYLEQIRKLNQDREIPIASYISYPRSSDVVNALRVALCPRDTVDSDKCPECKTRECDFGSRRARPRTFFRIIKLRREVGAVHQPIDHPEALRQTFSAFFLPETG